MMEGAVMKRLKPVTVVCAVVLTLSALVLGSGGTSFAAPGHASSLSIALSNSYAGNSWRQQMIKTYAVAGKTATDRGLIAKWTIVNADNSATQQISQIQNMILQHWSAITIDAASPTALNGVIARACAAGIKVVVFDSLATAPCAYKVAYNYVSMGLTEANYVAQRLHGKGNALCGSMRSTGAAGLRGKPSGRSSPAGSHRRSGSLRRGQEANGEATRVRLGCSRSRL